ncbi:MAG: hypothetical protein R3D00_20265 [Bacteroidia bacterium]
MAKGCLIFIFSQYLNDNFILIPMTPALRKRHLYTWAILGILVPVGFYMAILVIPKIQPGKVVPNLQPQPLEDLVRSVSGAAISAHLRAQTQSIVKPGTDMGLPAMEDTYFQLELLIHQPLRTPSALVYLALEPGSTSVEGKLLIGRLGATGAYRFNLDNLPDPPEKMYLLIYDDYHQMILKEIEL